jgi:hypothetical protein
MTILEKKVLQGSVVQRHSEGGEFPCKVVSPLGYGPFSSRHGLKRKNKRSSNISTTIAAHTMERNGWTFGAVAATTCARSARPRTLNLIRVRTSSTRRESGARRRRSERRAQGRPAEISQLGVEFPYFFQMPNLLNSGAGQAPPLQFHRTCELTGGRFRF